MPGTSAAVDTNIVIALLAGEEEVLSHFENTEQVLLPFPVKAELIFGAMNSSRPDHNLAQLNSLFARFDTVSSSPDVEYQYAEIKMGLKQKGKPIPENDIWVAACAKAAGIPLSTRDEHFDAIDGLSFLRW